MFSILLLIVFSSSVNAQWYEAAVLVMNDGTVKKGSAQYVVDTHKRLRFKSSIDGKSESLTHQDIKRITYYFPNDTTIFERLSYYTNIKSNKLIHDSWFELVQPGYVSIYLVRVSLGGGKTIVKSGSSETPSIDVIKHDPAKFKDYYAFKEGEPGGRQISSVSSMNNNAVFKKFAPIYFSDYPELAEKIKNKEYTYEDILEVTNIYNDWIAAKKK